MGVLDFLFEGSPPPNVNSTTTTTTNMPDWYQEYTRGLLGKANTIAADALNYNTGSPVMPQQVAGFTDPTQKSFDMTIANNGIQNPAFATAGNTFANVAGGFDQNQFSNYMNPYTENVNNTIATLGARNLSENLLPAVNDTFTGAGQFGGSRNAEFTNRAIRDTNQSILNQQSQNMNQGFQTSMGNYLQGQSQGLAAGQDMTALGQAQNQIGLQQAAAMNAIGQQQQGQQQQVYNTDVANFNATRDYPQQVAAFMNQQIRGFNPPTSTTSSVNGVVPGVNYTASPLAQVAAAGSAAAGISKMF
jgi:hypothetical protein